MPAKSEAQRRAAAMALQPKRGNISVSQLTGAAKQMYDSMTLAELEEYAQQPRKNIPYKVKKRKKDGGTT